MSILKNLEIPLLFLEENHWPENLDPPFLGYEPKPYKPKAGARPQPVLQGRTVLTPLIDLNDYECRAVIDWIEVRLTTPERHQARNMQPKVEGFLNAAGSKSSVWVGGPGREAGYLGDAFVLKFQEPEPPTLARVLAEVADTYVPGLRDIGRLQLAGLEISVDFYAKDVESIPRTQSDLLRWRMVDTLRRLLRPEPILTEQDRCHPRFYGNPNGGSGATFFVEDSLNGSGARLRPLASQLKLPENLVSPLRLGAHNELPIDRTSYIGAKGYPVALRIMDKITDQRDPDAGTARDLPPELCRARVEVTLQGEHGQEGGHGAVELRRLSDLYGYRFQTLRPTMFEFYLPTFGDTSDFERFKIKSMATEEKVFSRSGAYGLDRLHRSIEAVGRQRFRNREIAKPPAKLGKKGRLISFQDLNQKVDRALKSLTRKWCNEYLYAS